MDIATGVAVLFVGVALAWIAVPGRMPWPIPLRLVRIAGLAVMFAAVPWFVDGGGWFVGLVQYAVGLSFVATAVALAAPLHPRIAPVATGCAALVACLLEIAG